MLLLDFLKNIYKKDEFLPFEDMQGAEEVTLSKEQYIFLSKD